MSLRNVCILPTTACVDFEDFAMQRNGGGGGGREKDV
jgi:hypothetical protein